jgi:hypothetical protein
MGVLAAALIGLPGACRRSPSGESATTIHAEYLLIYSLSEHRDAEHAVAISDRSGKTWYRHRSPGLDLGEFNIEAVRAQHNGDLPPKIVLPTRDPHSDRLESWLRQHLGGYGGIVIGGELVMVWKVVSVVTNEIQIPAFRSLEEATRVADTIKAGGAATMASSQPTTRPHS